MGLILNILGIILLEQRTYSSSDYDSSDFGEGWSSLGMLNLLIISVIVFFIIYFRNQRRNKKEEEEARKRAAINKPKPTPAPDIYKPTGDPVTDNLNQLAKSMRELNEYMIAEDKRLREELSEEEYNKLKEENARKIREYMEKYKSSQVKPIEKKEKKDKFSWSMRQNYYGNN